ncbi:hypothetical protein HYT23_00850 [Candidatus Pacearchaeota archaeon]|nr:hypothetical protein [Candidatus Pacearchaeota archaeon]
MSIDLCVEPRKVYTWDEFRLEKPSFSIALDGIVNGPTMREHFGPYANFDHHAGVDRTSTRSTSEQVYMEINLDLFDQFRKNGIPHANVFVNDPDEDTCLAWWLLKNHEEVSDHANPKINRLVSCEDKLDCTAGAYPFGDIKMRRQMAWIFQPYTQARFEEKLGDMGVAEMTNLIESVEKRISEHIFGTGGEIALEGNYEKIGGGKNWTFVKETGSVARMAMYNDGIKAFISFLSEKDGGFFVYSVGRKSGWVKDFPIPRLYDRYNYEEKKLGAEITQNNRWNGGDTTGGSPKKTGSKIPPEILEEITNDELEKLGV